ncbi:MAG: putative porin [Chthoniobacteraceae bacterium]|nr:putative porin [Chthoniobacteraceae bacterium]
MPKSSFFLATLLLAAISGAACAQQDGGALIDMLVCKKILTPKEAECLRADLAEEKEKSSAGKIKLSGPVTELKLYGDLRLRNQYDNLDHQELVWNEARDRWENPGHGDQRDRWRVRLRLNADFKLQDQWFGGVQLQSNRSSDRGNQTFDGGFKNYDIFISRVFVGWKAADWLTLVAGKQPNPFYTTDLLWDPDVNPSGVAEVLKIHELFGRGGQPPREERPWTLTLATGQFFFDDNQEFDPPGYNTDAYLFAEQLIFTCKLGRDVKLTLAPAFLRYNSAQVNLVFNQQGFAQIINGTATDGLPPGFGETRDLSVIDVPGDLSFKVCGWKLKLLWDGAYNTAGAKRVNDIYVYPIRNRAGAIVDYNRVSMHSGKDDYAWLAGFQLGENEKKGDWTLLVNYRQVGLGAIDPNLNDSDWMLSRLNMRGWKVVIAYNFTDAVLVQLTGYTGDNLRKNLIGGQATNGANLANANSVQGLQAALNVKF